MIKNFKSIYCLLLASALVCSCGQLNDDEVQADCNCEQNEIAEGEAPVRFLLTSNTAGEAGTTRSAEDSYDYTQGTPEEYQVNYARLYLYNSDTKLFAKTFLLANLTPQGSDASGNIVYESERVGVAQGTYDIFVVANSSRVIDANTEEEFLADIDAETYTQGLITNISSGIVMTNRATSNLRTVIRNESMEELTENVVSVQLERVLARLDVAKSRESFELTTPQNVRYATVTLNGFYIVNLARKYYSYRHVAQLTSLTEPEWSLETNFGPVNDVDGYVIDPYFFKKVVNAENFTNTDKYYEHFIGDLTGTTALPSWTEFAPVSTTPQYKTAYCPENCMLAPAQKNGYSTGVFFRAKLEPNNNVYQLNAAGELELATGAAAQPDVLYYYGYNFYTSPEAMAKAAGMPSIPAESLDLFNARKFEKSADGYCCYYDYWIRHMDNNRPTEMGVMEFAVVRNNLYRMLITNVAGLGEPLPLDGWLPNTYDSDTPDEGETKLKVILNVKPWIVRDLTNIVL